MKSARTRSSAVSLLVSISVAGTMCAGVASAVAAGEPGGAAAAGSSLVAEVRAGAQGLVAAEPGDLAVAAGLVFALPGGAVAFEAEGLEGGAWIDERAGLFVAAIPQVATGVSGLSLGSLVAAATDLAISLDGRVTGFCVYDGGSTPVFAYDVAFVHAGVPLHGTLGFVPLDDGSLTALVCLCKEEAAAGLEAAIQELYEGVDLAF